MTTTINWRLNDLRWFAKPIFCLTAATLFGMQPNLFGQEDSSSFPFFKELPEIVITGEHKSAKGSEAIQLVKVISKEEIESSGASDLQELLQKTVAISIDENLVIGGAFGRTSLNGISGNNIQVLVNGVPQIGRNDGELDLRQFALSNLVRVEIVEGPMSAEYGNNAAGGVINLITKKSQPNPWELDFGANAETKGISDINLRLGHHVSDWFVQASGRRFDFVGYPDSSDRDIPWKPKRLYSGNLFVRHFIDAESSASLKSTYTHEDIADLGHIRRPQFLPYALDDYYKTRKWEHAFEGTFKLKGSQSISGHAAFTRFNFFKDARRYDIEPDSTSEIPTESDSVYLDNFSLRPVFAFSLARGEGIPISVRTGVEVTTQMGKGARFAADENVRFSNLAAFAAIRHAPNEAWSFQLGNRIANHSRYGFSWTPTFNILHRFNQPKHKHQFRLAVGSGFRAPGLKELYLEFIDANHHVVGDPDLKPETAWHAQLAWNNQIAVNEKIGVNASAKIFYNSIKDKISLFEFDVLKFKYANISFFQNVGTEMGLEYKQKNFIAETRFNYIRTSEALDEPTDWLGSSSVNYKFSYDFEALDLTVSLQGKQWGVRRNYLLDGGLLVTRKVDPYNLTDVQARKTFWDDRIAVTAGVKNIFNTKTTTLTGEAGGIPHVPSSGESLVNWGTSFVVGFKMKMAWGKLE